MSAEAFLFGTLSAASGVTAFVGAGAAARIYPDEAKEGAAVPLIVFDQGTTEYNYGLNDSLQAHRTTISVTCWSTSRVEAEAVADAVIVAMSAAGEIASARDSDFDDANQAYAAIVTFNMWNR